MILIFKTVRFLVSVCIPPASSYVLMVCILGIYEGYVNTMVLITKMCGCVLIDVALPFCHSYPILFSPLSSPFPPSPCLTHLISFSLALPIFYTCIFS